MIARVVTYATSSLDASRAWIREHEDRIRSIEGLVRFEVVSQADPPRAGGIVYFDSRQAYESYRKNVMPKLQQLIERSSWSEGVTFEQVFEVEETLVAGEDAVRG